MNKSVKPLFKYIGGKSWLRESLREHLKEAFKEQKFKSYCEPFTGGLGSFLSIYDLLIENDIKKVTLSDINANLIKTYQLIKNNPEDLIKDYLSLEKNFVSRVPQDWNLTKDKNELKVILIEAQEYFNFVKKEFNENKFNLSSEQSARLIFLQKHAFNGVYRENSKGQYNTPFNWSGANMLNLIESKVLELHDIFIDLDIDFKEQSFEDVDYNLDTIYYLDPPYINEEIGENKYNKNIFDIDSQILLLDKIKDTSFIYSNHKAEILLKTFESFENIDVQEIMRKNIMSANSKTREQDKTEILVRSVKRI